MATGIVALIPNIWHVLRFFTVLLKGTVRGFAFDFELAIYWVESPKHRVLAGSLAGRRPTVIWILILFSGNATTLHRFERKEMSPGSVLKDARAQVETFRPDRRLHPRYPITLGVHYKLPNQDPAKQTGSGKTRSISWDEIFVRKFHGSSPTNSN